MFSGQTVFVVDDDAGHRESVCALAASMGCRTSAFASAEAFLAGYPPGQRGVVVADLRMPGMSGLDLQLELSRRGWPLPLIILTAYARTATTVRAIQAGAVAMLDKPCHDDDLWEAVRLALDKEEEMWAAAGRLREIEQRIHSLTSEELQVAELLIEGRQNKLIARQLGIAIRTVEKRRHAVLEKMKAQSIAELVALFLHSRED